MWVWLDKSYTCMTENSCVSKMAAEWLALKRTLIVRSWNTALVQLFSEFAPLSHYLALWLSSHRRWEAPFPFLFSIFCAFCLFSPHLKHDLLSLISPTLSLYGPLCLSPLSKSGFPGLCPFAGSLSLSLPPVPTPPSILTLFLSFSTSFSFFDCCFSRCPFIPAAWLSVCVGAHCRSLVEVVAWAERKRVRERGKNRGMERIGQNREGQRRRAAEPPRSRNRRRNGSPGCTFSLLVL